MSSLAKNPSNEQLLKALDQFVLASFAPKTDLVLDRKVTGSSSTLGNDSEKPQHQHKTTPFFTKLRSPPCFHLTCFNRIANKSLQIFPPNIPPPKHLKIKLILRKLISPITKLLILIWLLRRKKLFLLFKINFRFPVTLRAVNLKQKIKILKNPSMNKFSIIQTYSSCHNI